MQVSEAIFKYGRVLGVQVVPVYGGQPIGRQLQALDRGVARGRRHARARPRPHRSRVAAARPTCAPWCSTRPTRCSTWASPRTSSRSSGRCPTSARRCCSRRPCRRASPASPSATCGDPVRITIAGADTSDRTPALVTQRAYVVQRAHKPAALGPHPRHRGAEGRPRLLPHTHRGRPADRDDERARLPRRGAARRHGPGPARPRDGPAARRHRRAAHRHRRRRPRARRRRAHPRRQLRRARRRPRATCTASGASGGRGARVWPSRWPSRGSSACSPTSSG